MNKNILSNLSTRPGIYKFIDARSNIIYIGKALNLYKRVSSYFSKSVLGIKTKKLVENISTVEVIITESEEEALILENTLIKKFKPKYNILLRDDKSYPYIFIDKTHEYPSIKFYRGSRTTKKGFFFGPYTQVTHVRYMINLVQKIFKIRSCENSFFKMRKKPCLQYQINRCDAPCVQYINKEEYKSSIQNTVLFLQGKNDALIKKYNIKMMSLSDKKEYEEASLVRDKIAMIRSLTQSKNIISNQKNMDIITLSQSSTTLCIDVFLTRDGVNLGNKTYDFDIPDSDAAIVLNSFIKQYYLKNNPPEKIIIPLKFQDSTLLKNILYKKYAKIVRLIYANRKPYSSWLKTCQANTDDRLKLLLSAKNKDNLLSTLNKDLKYSNKISTIICCDISHMSGSNTQGSSVWYDKNGSNKKNYRRYNLTQINKFDDYDAIRYVLSRRLKKLLDQKSLPDLILIDGGKGQITQVINILVNLNITHIPVLGLVKGHKRHSDNDRVLDENFNDITLSLSNYSLRLLQSIRDEAHRFAITGQRQKTQKKQFDSKLDSIPGVGKVRKFELLKYYGGIQGVIKSPYDDLLKVPGINSQLADIIYKHLHSK